MRALVGVIAALLIGAGAVALILSPGSDLSVAAGASIRIGLVMGAIWLALPAMRGITRSQWVAIGVIAAIIAIFPRLLWAIPILLVLALFARSRFRSR